MPTYHVTAPDGSQFQLEGDEPPSESDLDQIFSNRTQKAALGEEMQRVRKDRRLTDLEESFAVPAVDYGLRLPGRMLAAPGQVLEKGANALGLRPMVSADSAADELRRLPGWREYVEPNLGYETSRALSEFGGEQVSSLTRPDTAALALTGLKVPVPVGRTFQAQTIAGLPSAADQLRDAAANGNTIDTIKAGLNLGASVAIPTLIEHGLTPSAQELPNVTGKDLLTPQGARLAPQTAADTLQTVSPAEAELLAKQMTRDATVGYQPPKERKGVPGTAAEDYETVLQTIQKANAHTKKAIQSLFPKRGLSNEEAAELRDRAWPQEAFERTIEATSPKEPTRFSESATASPKPLIPTIEGAREVAGMSPDEFMRRGQSFNGTNLKLGQTVTDEQLPELVKLQGKANDAMKAAQDKAAANPKDEKALQDFVTQASKAQFFNEAIAEAQRVRAEKGANADQESLANEIHGNPSPGNTPPLEQGIPGEVQQPAGAPAQEQPAPESSALPPNVPAQPLAPEPVLGVWKKSELTAPALAKTPLATRQEMAKYFFADRTKSGPKTLADQASKRFAEMKIAAEKAKAAPSVTEPTEPPSQISETPIAATASKAEGTTIPEPPANKPEITQTPPETQSGANTPVRAKPSFYVRPRSDGVPDILDAIQEQGGIAPLDSKQYGNWRDSFSGTARLLLRKTGLKADQLVDILNNRHGGVAQTFRVDSVDDLLSAIRQASESRKKLTETGGGEEARTARFWDAVTDPKNKLGLEKVNVQDLHVGETFRIRGEGISHEELTVTHLDPHTGAIQVKDGPKLGTQDIPDNTEIWVQRGTRNIEEPLFSPPESIEEQKAREANEIAQKQKAAQKEELARRQAAPLVGSRGDIGQTDMLGGGDLLSGPPVHITGTPSEGSKPLGIVASSTIPNISDFAMLTEPIRRIPGAVRDIWNKFALKAMPRTTDANREAGEAGARYGAAPIVARDKGILFSEQVTDGIKTRNFDSKFGTALTEDNLRGIKQSFLDDGDLDSAQAVTTLIGRLNSPFRTEREYQDFLASPEAKLAIERHKQLWEEQKDPIFRKANDLDPDLELESRGQQTGARVNLKAVMSGEGTKSTVGPAARPSLIRQTATLLRRDPFARQAKGTGQSYEGSYREIMANGYEREYPVAAQHDYINTLIDSGLARVTDREKPPGFEINGQPTEGRLLRLNPWRGKFLQLPKSLVPEFDGVTGLAPASRISGFTPFAKFLTTQSVQGLAEGSTHAANILTDIFTSVGPTGNPVVNAMMKALGRSDLAITLPQVLIKAIAGTKEEMMQLGEIGAGKQPYKGTIGFILNRVDKGVRLNAASVYKALADNGWVENTETGLREFVNKVGNYNKRLQPQATRFLRDTGVQPFVTAAQTFGTMGLREMALAPAVKATSTPAALALRMDKAGGIIGGVVVLCAINALLNKGNVSGAPGTRIGQIGWKGDDGKLHTFDLGKLTGMTRGLSMTGVKGFLDARNAGLSTSEQLKAAGSQAGSTALSAVTGPAVQFLVKAATGKRPGVPMVQEAKVVSPSDSRNPLKTQAAANIAAALRESNPAVDAILSRVLDNKSLSDIAQRQFSRYTPRTGPAESTIAALPKIVRHTEIENYAAQLSKDARKLPLGQRAAFINQRIKDDGVETKDRAAVIKQLRLHGTYKYQ